MHCFRIVIHLTVLLTLAHGRPVPTNKALGEMVPTLDVDLPSVNHQPASPSLLEKVKSDPEANGVQPGNPPTPADDPSNPELGTVRLAIAPATTSLKISPSVKVTNVEGFGFTDYYDGMFWGRTLNKGVNDPRKNPKGGKPSLAPWPIAPEWFPLLNSDPFFSGVIWPRSIKVATVSKRSSRSAPKPPSNRLGISIGSKQNKPKAFEGFGFETWFSGAYWPRGIKKALKSSSNRPGLSIGSKQHEPQPFKGFGFENWFSGAYWPRGLKKTASAWASIETRADR
ncbi:hypothetical protein A4X13_0g4312 [Tilletia indica]|uniref:Uncharacterized protein n=1 Tax=Tilletia indica TaxID=43049 RepID=A0A177TWL5_9BASI|nr:hypothetical protein A4X13_0g4312 [Tilletia indica]